MPVTLVDRLPLPNLKAYTAGSVLLLSVAVFHALSVTRDPNWRANAALQRQKVMSSEGNSEVIKVVQIMNTPNLNMSTNSTRNLTEQVTEVMTFMMQEPLCMWTLINISYCALAVFGLVVQRLVFGRLRVAEAQRIKDKLWNFVFYKFIFVFGVINVQYMDEVLLWCSWFTVIGFLHLLAQLCKDRFEYLSSSPSAGLGAHARLLLLLAAIQAVCLALFVAAVRVGLPAGKDTFAFMAAECVLVSLSALHVVARYWLQAADAAGPLAYYTHLVFDATSLGVELAHVVHMVVYSNLVLSVGSLVLLLQLRHLLHRLRARLRRHSRYTALATHMSTHYPMASKEEVALNQDNCAICWEPMKEARKLPCSHLFHNGCLCQWVQQDASCPTCRRALSPAAPAAPEAPAAPTAPAAPALRLLERAPPAFTPPNHLFHFDASRYVSWLPSLSVEVRRVRDPSPHQLALLVQQVQAVFPQFPAAALSAALAVSRSVPATVDDILAGRLLPPEPQVEAEPEVMSSVPPSPPELPEDDSSGSTATEEHGTWFEEDASEREATLRRRRQLLVAAARRKYLERHPTPATHS